MQESQRFQKLSKYLSQLEQETEDRTQLDVVAGALAQEQILNHKSKDVKILAACCLADVIRIYAPEAPYPDERLLVCTSTTTTTCTLLSVLLPNSFCTHAAQFHVV
jgi:hypothetical protein